MKVLSITGGKGGIGKSTLTVNMALSFAKQGKKVMIFDADLGLANIDVLLGVRPEKTIFNFVKGECSLEEVCISGPHGIKIIPSPSGIQEMADLSSDRSMDLVQAFSTLTSDVDILLVDMASGITRQVIELTHAAQSVLVIICNDPASLVDSFAVIKILHQQYGRNSFGIVVNKVKNLREGYSVFIKFQETLARFININVEYIGFVPNDDYIALSARSNAPVVEKYPGSHAAQALTNLSHGVYHWLQESQPSGGIQFFFERLVQSSDTKESAPCEE